VSEVFARADVAFKAFKDKTVRAILRRRRRSAALFLR